MLRAIATGDAYGSAFEFTRHPPIPNDLSRLGPHALSGRTGVTDDTLRSVANARVLLDPDRNARMRPEAWAKALIDVHRDDGRQGWSRRFQAMLEAHADRDGADLVRAISRRRTNGCIMGACPIGFLPDPAEVLVAATMQTVSTHSAAAVPYVQVVALAAHHAMRGAGAADATRMAIAAAEWSDDAQRKRFARRLDDEPPVPDMPVETIAAGALWAINNFAGASDALLWTCSRGGDCDSLAAVTMALAWACPDVADDLPDHLVAAAEADAAHLGIERLERRLVGGDIAS